MKLASMPDMIYRHRQRGCCSRVFILYIYINRQGNNSNRFIYLLAWHASLDAASQQFIQHLFQSIKLYVRCTCAVHRGMHLLGFPTSSGCCPCRCCCHSNRHLRCSNHPIQSRTRLLQGCLHSFLSSSCSLHFCRRRDLRRLNHCMK